jgi:hypothetical protein
MSLNEDLSAGSRAKLNMHVAKSLYRMVQKSLETRGNIEHRVANDFWATLSYNWQTNLSFRNE